jgi:hypothetical protein
VKKKSRGWEEKSSYEVMIFVEKQSTTIIPRFGKKNEFSIKMTKYIFFINLKNNKA